jgi:hypothetical protein
MCFVRNWIGLPGPFVFRELSAVALRPPLSAKDSIGQQREVIAAYLAMTQPDPEDPKDFLL